MSCPPFRRPHLDHEIAKADTDEEKWALHERNWRELEDFIEFYVCCDCGGGEPYCSNEDVNVVVDGGTGVLDGAGQTVTLTTRSTVAVTATYSCSSPAGEFLLFGRLYKDTDQYFNVAGVVGQLWDISYYASTTASSAITLDPGTYTFLPHVNVEATVDDTYAVNVKITVIVGANTEDNCFSGIE